jgi:hypothetical protein
MRTGPPQRSIDAVHPTRPGLRRRRRPRQVTVQGPPGVGGVGETLTSRSSRPCTRYYLVAVKSTALANDFTVRIDHQEPVSGCSPA